MAENDGSTVWTDREARLVDCVAQLKGNKAEEKERKNERKWEEQYAEFESCVEMPANVSKLNNWKKTQLGNQPYGLDARIKNEIAENKGSTMWTDRKAWLLRCIAQKRK